MTADNAPITKGDGAAHRKPTRRIRQWIVVLGAALVVLVAASWAWRHSRVAAIPDIGEPFDVEAFLRRRVDPAENAAIDYHSAVRFLRKREFDSRHVGQVEEFGWSVATDELKAWVELNRPTLEPFLKASGKSEFLNRAESGDRPDSSLIDVHALRSLAEIAALEAARLEFEDRTEDAWELRRAIFRSSRLAGWYGDGPRRLGAASIHSVAVNGVLNWASHPRLVPESLERAFREIRSDDALTPPLADVVKATYCRNGPPFSFNATEIVDSYVPLDKPLDRAMARLEVFLANEPLLGRLVLRQICANQLAHVDAPRVARPGWQLSMLDGPFGDHTLFLDSGGGEGNLRLASGDIARAAERSIVARLIGTYFQIDQVLRAVDLERARQELLTVSLAVRIYKARNGDWPESLDAVLRAGLLESVPADPYSLARDPVRYRSLADGAMIWSVGPDGVDDEGELGTPDPDIRRKTSSQYPPDLGFRFRNQPVK